MSVTRHEKGQIWGCSTVMREAVMSWCMALMRLYLSTSLAAACWREHTQVGMVQRQSYWQTKQSSKVKTARDLIAVINTSRGRQRGKEKLCRWKGRIGTKPSWHWVAMNVFRSVETTWISNLNHGNRNQLSKRNCGQKYPSTRFHFIRYHLKKRFVSPGL